MMNVKKISIVYKNIILSIISFTLGVVIYLLFNNAILYKDNLIFTIIRNYCSDILWIISFFFIAIIFSKNITKRYYLLTSIFCLLFGILFEIMQLINLANGTFDLIDIFVYFVGILIACSVERYMEVLYEKN